jgi:hypothetical protein
MKKNKSEKKSEKTFNETLLDLIDNSIEEKMEVTILRSRGNLEVLAIVKFFKHDWITFVKEDCEGNVSTIDIDWEVNDFIEIISNK